MEEVQINGQAYISSKRAAEISGYTQDYVGQLARDRKISATRIGRSWYIDESDLREHAGIDTPACEDESEQHDQEHAGEESPPLKEDKATTTIPLNTLHTQNKQPEKPDVLYTWSSVTYIKDDAPAHLPLKEKYTPYNERIVPVQKKVEGTRKVGTAHIQPRIHKNLVHTSSLHASQSMGGVIPHQKETHTPLKESRVYENKKPSENNYVFISYFLPVALIITLIVMAGGAHVPAEWSFTQDANTAFSSGAVSDEAQGAIISYFGTIFMQGIDLIAGFLTTLLGSFGVLFELGIDFLQDIFAS
ncbi:MAG: helix-turn-helix domain-containing protein [Patescibacteria group bacterium UBA2163]